MRKRLFSKGFGTFLLSFLLGTMYAVLVGLVSGPLRASLISWPVWVGLLWFLFWKFNLLRFAGFIAVLPVSVLGFEILWSATNPGMNAEIHEALDRSHYMPGFRVRNFQANSPQPSARGWGLKGILIGKDGFRADPETGEGNPERCQFALIGDSMIYGTGMPYPFTLGPVLASMGIKACVFGVTGNSPVDYLATLKYVADRVDPGAHVAFYLYAYNDFVSLNKYLSRGFLSLSNWFHKLFAWAFYFDRWRQGTFIHSVFRSERVQQHSTLWQYPVGKAEPIRILYPRDPAQYKAPPPLNKRERVALQFFFSRLTEFSSGRFWQISIVIHPDDAEIYTNFARRSRVFEDLDPRRAEAMKMCKEYSFVCDDISRYIYERSVAEGKNPYFIDNRHFSVFGTRIVAEHFVAQTNRLAERAQAAAH